MFGRVHETSQRLRGHDLSFQSVSSRSSPISIGNNRSPSLSVNSCLSPRTNAGDSFSFPVHECWDSHSGLLKTARTLREFLCHDEKIKNNDKPKTTGTNWSSSSGSSYYDSHGSDFAISFDSILSGEGVRSSSSASSSSQSAVNDYSRSCYQQRFGGANWSISSSSSSCEAHGYQHSPLLSQEPNGSEWSQTSVV